MVPQSARLWPGLVTGVVISLLLGAVVGYVAATSIATTPRQESAANILLYGSDGDVERLLHSLAADGEPLVHAIHEMLTDYRDRQPIRPERKELLLLAIQQNSQWLEVPRSLALGSIQDPDRDVRKRCIEALLTWKASYTDAEQVVRRNIKDEDDGEVRQLKERLIRGSSSTIDIPSDDESDQRQE